MLTGIRGLPRRDDSANQYGGWIPTTSVHAQNTGWFYNIRLRAKEETEAWGGILGVLAREKGQESLWGPQRKMAKLQLLCHPAISTPAPPDTPDNMAVLPQAPRLWWGGVWLGPQEK